MSQATVLNLFVEGFSGYANTDIVFSKEFIIKNNNDEPFNFDGATSSFKAKRSYSDATPVIVANTSNDGISLDSNTGILLLTLNVGHLSNVSLNRESTDFVYDLDLRADDGQLHRLFRGTITVGGDV